MTLNRLTDSISHLARAAIALAITAIPLAASAHPSGYVLQWGNYQAMPPGALSNVKAIAAGYSHFIALKGDGTVIAWGVNNQGETNVPPGLVATAIATSTNASHSLAIRPDGTVAAWGSNSFGACNVPPGLTGVVAVATGFAGTSLALKSDGTVVGWGTNYWGQLTPPSDLTDAVKIASSTVVSFAVKSDGTVVSFGAPGGAEKNVPPGLTGVVDIACGFAHAVALKSDGTVVAWGQNTYGETDVPSGLSNVVAISAGEYSCLALKSDGSIVGWGLNNYGSLSVPPSAAGALAIATNRLTSIAIMPPHPFPATFSVTKPTVTGGRPGPETGILALPIPVASDTVFTLSSSSPAATVPTTVTIPSGQLSATFPIWSNRVLSTTHVTITAATPLCLDGTLDMTLNPFTLDRIRFSGVVGGEVECGKPYTATVYLDAPTREPVVIDVACDIPWAAPESSHVTVPAGSIKGTVTINTQWHNLTQYPVITATLGDSSVNGSVTVVPFPTIVSLTANKPILYGHSTGSFTITLARPALAGGTTVNVNYSRGGMALSGPTSVTIPQGKTTARFPVTYSGGTHLSFAANVYVSNFMSEVGGSVQLEPILVKSIALSQGSVQGGTDVTATVTLNHKVEFDTYVAVSSNSPYVFSVSSVVVRAGSRTGTSTFHTTLVRNQKSAFIMAFCFFGVDDKTKKLQITP